MKTEQCVLCEFKSSDPSQFTGDDPVLCIGCHLELLDEGYPVYSPAAEQAEQIDLLDVLESQGKIKTWGNMIIRTL